MSKRFRQIKIPSKFPKLSMFLRESVYAVRLRNHIKSAATAHCIIYDPAPASECSSKNTNRYHDAQTTWSDISRYSQSSHIITDIDHNHSQFLAHLACFDNTEIRFLDHFVSNIVSLMPLGKMCITLLPVYGLSFGSLKI